MLALLLLLTGAEAHDLGYTRVEVRFSEPDTWQVDVRVDPPDDAADPEHWLARAEQAVPDQVILAFDGALVKQLPILEVEPQRADLPWVVRYTGTVPAGAEVFTFRSAPDTGPWSLIVNDHRDDSARVELLRGGEASEPVVLGALSPLTVGQVFVRYTWLGVVHIVPRGLDHILFVVGLFLLAARVRPLLAQITAFTVAHSLTLALALYGWVAVPAAVVEPLIAASIVFVGVENLLTDRVRPWRVAVVFAFGLLHGLGFAGVLSEFGLPPGQRVAALVAFNIGVELGQLVVVALAFAAVGWAWRRRWYRSRVVVPLSVGIAGIGLYWTAARLLWG